MATFVADGWGIFLLLTPYVWRYLLGLDGMFLLVSRTANLLLLLYWAGLGELRKTYKFSHIFATSLITACLTVTCAVVTSQVLRARAVQSSPQV